MWLFVLAVGLYLVICTAFALCASVSVKLDMCAVVKTVSTHNHCVPLLSKEFFFEKEKVKFFEKERVCKGYMEFKNVHGGKRS